jgi:hypothetical protein
MKYLIKNKTIKNIVFLLDGKTKYLYPKGDKKGRDSMVINKITEQVKNTKSLKFIQVTKIEK